jgi:hypothetical protein
MPALAARTIMRLWEESAFFLDEKNVSLSLRTSQRFILQLPRQSFTSEAS